MTRTNESDNKPAGILARIQNVRREVTRIQKRESREVPYPTVNHDDVTEMIRPLCVAHGIMYWGTILPETIRMDAIPGKEAGGKLKLPICRFQAVWRVYFACDDRFEDRISEIASVEDTVPRFKGGHPVCINTLHAAHALDTQDKAPGKAESYAIKRALLKMFAVASGENDEARIAEEEIRDATLGTDEKAMIDLDNLIAELFITEAMSEQEADATLQEMQERIAKKLCRVKSYGDVPITSIPFIKQKLRAKAAEK